MGESDANQIIQSDTRQKREAIDKHCCCCCQGVMDKDRTNNNNIAYEQCADVARNIVVVVVVVVVVEKLCTMTEQINHNEAKQEYNKRYSE